MEEVLLHDYLKDKEMSDHEFIKRMKGYFGDKYSKGMGSKRMEYPDWDYDDNYNKMYGGYMNRHSNEELMTILGELDYNDKQKIMSMIKYDDTHRHSYGYDESHAKHIVSEMYHISGDKKYIGEKYDMNKAKEIYEKYKHSIPEHIEVCDVYIAINAQYHDYCELFKSWFGSNIDHKIIESAITFWFKDADYMKGNKVYKYFMES